MNIVCLENAMMFDMIKQFLHATTNGVEGIVNLSSICRVTCFANVNIYGDLINSFDDYLQMCFTLKRIYLQTYICDFYVGHIRHCDVGQTNDNE